MTRKNDARKTPTELETAVLGALWLEGPCTAHAIRTTFLESPSPKWSGSAGAIYPLLKRLERLELVASTPSPGVKRKQLDYAISRKGLSVLRRWLHNLVPGKDAALIHDPLRTRIFFLGLMTEEQKTRFFDDAMNEIRSQLALFQNYCDNNPEPDNRNAYFAVRNALFVSQARLDWLEEVKKEINQEETIQKRK